ncbi:MAG: CBS domain-containing protein [Deltaproteobacteria bacterium]|nr:CBS domain-containing protein [Deltaproteobacteria bacterium]
MLQAKDIMTREVITVEKQTSVKDLARLLIKKNISGVPVVEADGTLCGIVTEKDLISRDKKLHLPTVVTLFDAVIYLESEKHFKEDLKKLAASTVEDIMVSEVETISEETTLREIATLIADQGKDLLPVLREGEMVGIVGKADVVRSMIE